MGRRNITLTIEYCGIAYCGWQIQRGAPTVQSEMERALSELCGEEIRVTGCSRTDTGVHALEFVLNFYTSSTIPSERFPAAVNSFLPPDIVVRSAREVPEGFHARFDAKYKTYRYFFDIAPCPSAFLSGRVWSVKMPLPGKDPDRDIERSLEELNSAAACFVGTRDFSAFRAEGSNVRSTVRTVTDAKVFLVDSCVLFSSGASDRPLLCFEVRGNGFLYNMVRIMAGTLLDVYKGKLLPSEIPDIIRSKDRTRAGMTAPPDGLYLCKVEYDD